MIAVMISIQPKRCELIANGKKTVEVRKTKPWIDTPFKCYIYCTKSKSEFLQSRNNVFFYCENKDFIGGHGEGLYQRLNGKVIGEFVCDKIVYFGNIATDPWQYLSGNVHEEHKNIINNDACLTEAECIAYGGKYGWHISNLVIYDKPLELSEFEVWKETGYWLSKEPLKRPPQSWRYVEERTENSGSND